MDLFDVWPLFRLRLLTPRLELRIVRDEDLGALADAALAGVHDPAVMPFGNAWTDAPDCDLVRGMARWHWGQRSQVSVEDWNLNFAVLRDGVPIGVQDVRAEHFALRRTVSSGSWMTRAQQGQGLGTEMRAAMLLFVFDHLGAEVAESSAAEWNTASLGVSRRLGYRDNGVTRIEARGQVQVERRVRLVPEDFVRPEWTLTVEGAQEARAELLG
jgi:RimJ/RimL family protein N-acetyltransferase